jgi:hypothetical protein
MTQLFNIRLAFGLQNYSVTGQNYSVNYSRLKFEANQGRITLYITITPTKEKFFPGLHETRPLAYPYIYPPSQRTYLGGITVRYTGFTCHDKCGKSITLIFAGFHQWLGFQSFLKKK